MITPRLDLTVVIPTYGRAEKLPKLLALLSQQTLSASRFECIVVDDGSEVPVQLDSSAYPFPLLLLRRENGGPGAARNTAIEHTHGTLTLYLNDDTVPALDLLASHLAAHAAAPAKSIILGTFNFTKEAQRNPFVQILQKTDLLFSFSTLVEGEDLGWTHCWTCNLSLPTEALRLVNGFDEENFDYPIVEDVELGYRLQAQGYMVRHSASCIAEHDHVLDIRGYYKRMEELGFYLLRMWNKHKEKGILWCRTEDDLRTLFKHGLQRAEGAQRGSAPLIHGVDQLEEQAFGRVIDRETIEHFRAVIHTHGISHRLAGVHRAQTGVRVAEVQKRGAPSGQSTTVVIVSENTLEATRTCIASVRRAHDPERPTDIIVVDNGSTDGSAQWLGEQSNLTLIANPTSRGISAARNQALREGYGDWICFLSSEVQVTRGWLARAQYHGAVDPRVGCISFLAQDPTDQDSSPYTGDSSEEQMETFMDAHLAAFLHQGKPASLFDAFGFLVRKSVIERIGGFDERSSLGRFADEDYALRSLAAGFRHTAAVDVFLHHHSGLTPQEARSGHQDEDTHWQNLAAKWGAAGTPVPPIGAMAALNIGDGAAPKHDDIHESLGSSLASIATKILDSLPPVAATHSLPITQG